VQLTRFCNRAIQRRI